METPPLVPVLNPPVDNEGEELPVDARQQAPVHPRRGGGQGRRIHRVSNAGRVTRAERVSIHPAKFTITNI